MKFHRDAEEVPTEPHVRKWMVNKLFNHALWTRDTREQDFESLTCFMYVYVDPETETIEDDQERNTAFRIWAETGPAWDMNNDPHFKVVPPRPEDERWGGMHDTRMDCGAPDMETLLCELLVRVEFFYNDDGSNNLDAPECCGGHFTNDRAREEDWVDDCNPDHAGFCITCGFRYNEP